ncbi:MAG: hypothetical protein M0R75_08460 [Dehalococcoidia bacterium]|nr:hypothetical protein [Dehalococcoidia bacterium]
MAYGQSAYRETTPRGAANPWAVGATVAAGAFMMVAGAFEAIQGFAAILQDDFFVVGSDYAYEIDVTTLGWVHFVMGIIVIVTGVGVLSGILWARIVGMVLVSLMAIANFFTIPYYPVWSIVVIAASLLVIWSLATHSEEDRRGTIMR